MKDFYQILGIPKTASPFEIKRAYFLKAKKFHPDSGDEAELSKFYEVSEAYKTLSNPEKRKIYDASLEEKELTGGLEKPLAKEDPFYRSVTLDPAEIAKRQKELQTYEREIFWKAILRVILFTLITGAMGYGLSFWLAGSRRLGTLAGLTFGFFWALNNNFDLQTFIRDKKHFKFAQYGTYLLMILALGYFGFLVVYPFLKN